ncbi:hypothetical protein [Hydrogenophaga sp.]|uniref:hypothetical protein n=1 Tax=Hydrogenophaga sp. TaxID=1904254 RepID=UPI002FCA8416
MQPTHPVSSPSAHGLHSNRHRLFAWASWVLALLLPLGVAVQGFDQSPAALLLKAGLDVAQGADLLSTRAGFRWGLWAMVMLPAACLSFSLWQAGLCFARFARAEYLSTQVVVHLRRFTAGLLAAGLLGLTLPTALSLLLSTAAPPGQRSLVVSVGSQEALFLVLAALLWQMASVIAHAVAIDEENRQFV